MIIYIVRHAWAGEHGDPNYPDDRLRPLTPEGSERFSRVVDKMVERSFEPSVIATSPLVRCRQTADLILQRLPKAKLTELSALQPGSDLNEILKWSRSQKAESIAWVGHAPDVNLIAAALISRSGTQVHFPKGGIAAVEMDDSLRPGTGELRWFVTAKVLGC